MPAGSAGFNSTGLNTLTYLKKEYRNSEEVQEKSLRNRIWEGCGKIRFRQGGQGIQLFRESIK